jgi:hypothetical protein
MHRKVDDQIARGEDPYKFQVDRPTSATVDAEQSKASRRKAAKVCPSSILVRSTSGAVINACWCTTVDWSYTWASTQACLHEHSACAYNCTNAKDLLLGVGVFCANAVTLH